MKLEHKVAIVTGGAQGLGRGFAEAILQHGGQVCITDIQVEKGLKTTRDFEEQYGPGAAIFVRCDVTKDRDLINAFDTTQRVFGRLDILVNNAGIADETMMDKMIDINLRAVINGSKMAVERMSKSNGGNGGLILSIASTAGLTGVAHSLTYCATKHGVVGLTKSLGGTLVDMPEEGIRAVCLCPSYTKTDMTQSDYAQARHALQTESVQDKDMSRHTMASVGLIQIPDVVAAFLKLVDDDDNQGGVMDVTPKGMTYRYPRRLQSRL